MYAWTYIVNYCLLPIHYCLLPIHYCPFTIAYCLFTIAHSLLPIAYSLLPIHYCLFTFAYSGSNCAHSECNIIICYTHVSCIYKVITGQISIHISADRIGCIIINCADIRCIYNLVLIYIT